MKWSTSLQTIVVSTAALVFASPVSSRSLKLYKLKIVAPMASNLNERYLSIDTDGTVGVFTNQPAYVGGVPPRVPVPVSPSLSPSPSSALTESTGAKPQPPPAAEFFVTSTGTPSGSADAHYALHTYPVGIIDHALGLNGSATDGLRFLVDVASPNKTSTGSAGGPGGPLPDCSSFTLSRFDSGDDDNNNSSSSSSSDAAVDKRIPPPLPLYVFSYGTGHGSWLLMQGGSNTFAVAWYDGVSPITENYRRVDIVYEAADN
ncbi:hypothetical protein SCUCBS95973_005188 [Sporothrix curviconia]|uniref:Uncharacterized protein n=1 Tax=Sporothrix curviconia TaxID=1260050 RepID=A0ABP0BV24_9PEZI